MKSRFTSLIWLKGYTTKVAKRLGLTMYLYANVNTDGWVEEWEISGWNDKYHDFPLVYVSNA